ncbi:Septin-domain-containing protein [Cladochytrium replicatum]|nr:Septin-domain-containing protein [Cladochytrium replicatum]
MSGKVTVTKGSIGISVAQYVPEHSDEIGLSVGDPVHVLQVYEDDWVTGYNKNTKMTGLLPGNFLVTEEQARLLFASGAPQTVAGGQQPPAPAPAPAPAPVAATPPAPVTANNGYSSSTTAASYVDNHRLSVNNSSDSVPRRVASLRINPPNENVAATSSSLSTIPSITVDKSSPKPASLQVNVAPPVVTSVPGPSASSLYDAAAASVREVSPAAASPSNSQFPPRGPSLVVEQIIAKVAAANSEVGQPAAVPTQPANSDVVTMQNSNSTSSTQIPKDQTTATPATPPAPPEPELSEEEKLDKAKEKLDALTGARLARAPIPANIGAFKISVCGDSGIGKTSLIHRFMMMDEISEHGPLDSSEKLTHELKASTIPADQLHLGEEPMNLTFVDTFGFGATIDAMAAIEPVVAYHVAQFHTTDGYFTKSNTAEMKGTIERFLSSGAGGHTHVDLCIYGILHRVKPVDIEYMRRLSSVCAVVPVIFKADSMKPADIFKLKKKVVDELIRAKVTFYSFGLDPARELLPLVNAGIPSTPPYAISCSPLASTKMDEFDTLKTNLLYYFTKEIRKVNSSMFVEWRSKGAVQQQPAAAVAPVQTYVPAQYATPAPGGASNNTSNTSAAASPYGSTQNLTPEQGRPSDVASISSQPSSNAGLMQNIVTAFQGIQTSSNKHGSVTLSPNQQTSPTNGADKRAGNGKNMFNKFMQKIPGLPSGHQSQPSTSSTYTQQSPAPQYAGYSAATTAPSYSGYNPAATPQTSTMQKSPSQGQMPQYYGAQTSTYQTYPGTPSQPPAYPTSGSPNTAAQGQAQYQNYYYQQQGYGQPPTTQQQQPPYGGQQQGRY